MRTLIPMILAILLTGCRTQVLFVDPSTNAIRIGRARGEFFVQDQKGEWIRTTGRLPVGWYALKDPQ